jgi:uncharacterized membrane protein YebE (DUF533 family)
MNPDFLINGVLQSMMGGGRKRSRRAARYLTRGGSGLVSTAMRHPTALLTAAGVAWGIFETLQGQSDNAGAAGGQGLGGPPAANTGAPLPPLPNVAGADVAPQDDATRIVRLAVSAANADGGMNEKERAAILQQAREAGVADVLERELASPRPLAQIVSGVTDQAQRATLYVLAFTILRADEQLTGAERIYLAQLANLLGLDPGTTARLEKDAGERIDALGDQGQLGG